MDNFKISIITVCYNSEYFITDCIESVVSQCYSNKEYVIVDGGSNDSTVDIIRSFGPIIDQFVSESDDGIYDAMNKGLSLVSGDIIGILNSDDFYIGNNVLSKVAEIFESDSNIEVVLGGVDFVNNADLAKVVRAYSAFHFKLWMFRFGFMPPHPAIFIRKSTFDEVGNFNTGYRIASDFDFVLRLLLIKKAKFKIVDNNFVRMRTGGVSTSGFKSNLLSTKEINMSLRDNNFFSFFFLILLRLPIKYFTQIFKVKFIDRKF